MTTVSDDQALIPANDALPVLPYDPPNDQYSTREPDEPRPEGFTLPQVDGAVLTPQSFRQTRFADLPLYLPTLSNPVVSFDGGLNWAALEVSDKGVACILFSYLNQAENDFIELKLNDDRVGFHTVTEDEALKGTQIVLYAPSERFIREAGNTLQAFVTPLGGNGQQTKRFNIKVDIEHPGGRDPIANTGKNENLPKPIFPDDVIQFGVDSDTAGKGVPVIIDYYPVDRGLPVVNHRKVRDRIRLSIGGVVVEHSVSEFEAAGTAPITIWVYASTWATVGSGVHICEYNVIDEVGNASLGFSPDQELEVRLDNGTQPLLRQAYIDESEQDADGHDQLDADALDGKPATIIVAVRNEGYLANDTIRVRVNGLTADGVRIITFYDFPVVSPTILTAKIPWPFADILPLVKGRIQLTYQRIRTGVLPQNSDSAKLNIIGTPVEAGLAAPIVDAAIGGTLPDPTVNPFEVLIKPYPGQLSNDRVTLVLEGTFANGKPYYAEYSDMAGTGNIYFDLPNGPSGPIAQLDGGSLVLYYRVNNRPPSRRLELSIGETQASLRAPTTRQAVPPDHVFNPLVSKANLNVTVHHHASFVLNAVVTLHFEGSKAGGSNPPIAFPIDPNWLGTDLPFTIPRNIVLNNLNGSARLYYTVDAPGQPRQLISHDLVITVGGALELPEPVVLEATPIKPPSLASINPQHVLPPRPAIVTVRVTYAMLASDNVKVHIIGANGFGIGTPNIPMKPGIPDAGTDYITFTTTNVFVGANLGRTCRVFFEVTRDGATTSSRELTLEVENLSEQDFDLVSIPEASGGVINTAGSNNVQINKWPFCRAGQALWIYLTGTLDLLLRPGREVTPAEFSAGKTLDQIPRTYLDQLKHGDVVTVKAYASLDGTGEINSAVSFKEVSYAVSALNLRFVNTPYSVGPDGTLNNVELILGSDSRNPSAVVVTIPTTFSYADGSTGSKAFLTDENGALAIPGIRAPNAAGSYTFTATSGAHSATAEVTVKSLLPAGSIINLRRGPSWLAFLPNNLYFYASLSAVGAIVKIDSSSGEVLKEIDMGTTVRAIYCSIDGKKLYIPAGNSIIVVDTTDDKITNRIPVNGISANHTLDLSPDGKYIFTMSQQYIINSANVLRISTASETFDRAYRMGNVYTNYALCSADSTSFYTMDYEMYGYVYRYNIESGARTHVYTTGSYGNNMILSPDRSILYINNWAAGSRSTIIALPNLQAKSFSINIGFAYCMSGNRQNTRLISVSDTTRLLMDTVSGAITRRFTIAGRGLSIFSPDDQTIYHCEEGESRISITAAP
ncbi:YncE family protein [Pseudomonas sp.]|uniref:YncE family protein n=1 Tax=Pseudomonas sp. TaxID=306 RepID=UPI003FD71835